MSVNIFRPHSENHFVKNAKLMARKGIIGAILLTSVYAFITSFLTQHISLILLAFCLPVFCFVFFILTYSSLKDKLIYKLLNYFLVASSWVMLYIAYQLDFQLEYMVVMMTIFILIFQIIPTPKKLIYFGIAVFPGLMLFLILSNTPLQFSFILIFLFAFSFVLSLIITNERRKLLRTLNDNSSILKALINNTNDAFLLVDHLSKEIKDVNQRALKLFKIRQDESIFDDKFEDLFFDEDYIKNNRKLLRQSINEKGFYNDEVILKTHDNGNFWAYLFISPFSTNKNNYYLLQVKDIDVKKKFNQKLAENYETYRFILDQLDEFVYLLSISKNNKPKFDYLNPSIEKIYGVRKDEFITEEIQKEVSKRYHPDDITKMLEKKKVMLQTKKKTSFRYRIKPIGSDDYIWIEETVVPRLDDYDEVCGLFGLVKKAN